MEVSAAESRDDIGTIDVIKLPSRG